MEIFGNQIKQKLSNKYCCEVCDYFTDRKSNLNNHFNSLRHHKEIAGNNLEIKLSKLSKIKQNFSCQNCEKTFQTNAGLWKHKKKCVKSSKKFNYENKEYDDEDKDEISTKDLILMFFKQNSALQQSLLDMSKQITTTNNQISNHNNSHNQTTNNSFNLQFFLNETCKNAMNITDFANSIKLQLSDLISVGELGYVEGISNIIVKNLNALDVTQRPVHCTDKKRETIYIKDNDKWEKDEDDKKLKIFIKTIAFKNQKLFTKFKETYPDYNDSESKYSDQYSKIVIESLDDNNPQKEEKIIKKISKAVSIDSIKDN